MYSGEGIVRTAEGAPIPGAAVRFTNTQTSKSWVSWTDEQGKFDFPALPAGHYRAESSQLGFEPGSSETDLPAPSGKSTINLTLRVATLAELSGESKRPGARGEPGQNPQGRGGQNAQANGAGSGGPGGGGRGGRGAGGGRGQLPAGVANALSQGLAQPGGFQQTELTGETAGQADENPGAPNGGGGAQATLAIASGPAGAASSDSFLMQGTVGQGLSPNGPGGFGGFGGPGGGLAPNAPGGGPGGGQGGRGGGGLGGPGGGGLFGGGGPGGGGGGGGGAAFGGGGGGRFLRQQVNRIRFGFYDRYDSSIWDAKPYSITGVETPKVSHYDNRVGANIGGPLKIPHVYDGSDKTYFFLNYQHEDQAGAVNTFSVVPTMAEREGFFSVPIFMPVTGSTAPRTEFPNDTITTIDPAASKLLPFIPLPNVTLPNEPFNFLLQGSVPTTNNIVNVHVLHTINAKFNVQAGYNYSGSHADTFGNFAEVGGTTATRNQNVTLGLAQNWTPKFVNSTQVNYSRSRTQVLSDNSFVNGIASEVGILGGATNPIDFGFPNLSFASFSGFGDPVPALTRNQTTRFIDGVTYVHGTHTIKFGGEIRRIQLNSDSNPNPRGQFSFTGLMTSQLDANGNPVPGTGNDFADFLLGLPYAVTARFEANPNVYFRSWDSIAYAQDDWRVNSHFTFEYGLRYEVATPPIELNNQIANIDLNATATAAALVTPASPTGPFSGTFPIALIHGDYGNWAPRIGFAWVPAFIKPKTVIRGGYSIFYNESIYNTLATGYLAYQPPFATSNTILTTAASPLVLETALEQTQSTKTGKVTNTTSVNPFYKVGYAQIWMLGTETTLSRNWLIDFTYTGTKGTDLDLLRAPNRAEPGTSQLDTQNELTIPNFNSFTYDEPGANSIYNALQVRLAHRYTHGLLFQLIYTYGKSLDDASTIGGTSPVVAQEDLIDHVTLKQILADQRGLSSFDIRHQLRLFSVYELPFGERHRYATHGAAMHLLSNWRLNNVITWQTGNPFTALLTGAASNNSGTGSNFSERAEQVSNPNLGLCGGSSLDFFNTNAFAVPAAGTFGNERRGAINGPCSFSWNLSVAKGFTFGNSRDRPHRFEARWEIQNLTNTANFNGLSTGKGSTTFGQVTSAAAMRSMDIMLRFNF